MTLVALALLGLIGATPPRESPDTAAIAERAVAEQPRWSWPIGPPRQIVQPYEAPATRYSSGHRGIDLAAAPGAVVLAPADGVVYFSGRVVDRPVLTIEYPGEILASFEPVETTLAKGSPISRGSPIGSVASGGHCDGHCLHFGVRVRGEYVSPLLFFGEVQRAVLLPLTGESSGG
jgi:murein DD-endopeptidase MepM/ murein hydrolase activator NlpD